MKLRPFELGLVVFFGVLALLALVLLNTYSPSKSEEDDFADAVGSVSIWGTLPAENISPILTELAGDNEAYRGITYKYVSPESFDEKLIFALADGEAPDLVLMSHEKLAYMRKRLTPYSYESLPLRDIRTTYIDGAEIFSLSDGTYARPIAVDPLMMYWNRDILATEGFLQSPATWETLVNTMFPSIIRRQQDRSVQRSVVAMGEYGNVNNAFGVISALMLQSGTEGVTDDGRGGYVVKLQESIGGSGNPVRSTADFYSRFSRPSNALYSWNRAFSEDRLQFISEDLAFYFGFGSEGKEIERINPNLNFDIAEIPQGEAATVRRTYGKFYGLSLLSASDNIQGAGIAMSLLGSERVAGMIAEANNLVPTHRNKALAGSNDTYGRMTYKSAAVSYGWLNPKKEVVDEILERMMLDVNDNRRDLDGSVTDATARIRDAY